VILSTRFLYREYCARFSNLSSRNVCRNYKSYLFSMILMLKLTLISTQKWVTLYF